MSWSNFAYKEFARPIRAPATKMTQYLLGFFRWGKTRFELFDIMSHMIEQAYALITNDQEQILLTQESDDSWSLPGGARESSDEDMGATLIRELEEELGLTPETYQITSTDISVSFIYDERSKSRQGQSARIDLFLVKLEKEAKVESRNEIKNVKWYSIKEGASKLMFDEHRKLVEMGSRLVNTNSQEK